MDVEKELPTVHEEEQEEDSESDGEYTPSIAPQQERLPQDVPIESDGDEEMSRETTREPEMERIPSSRRRSAESLIGSSDDNTEEHAVSSGQSPTESRATESRAERPASEESPLAETWRRTGTTGPGVDLAGRGFDQTNLALRREEPG